MNSSIVTRNSGSQGILFSCRNLESVTGFPFHSGAYSTYTTARNAGRKKPKPPFRRTICRPIMSPRRDFHNPTRETCLRENSTTAVPFTHGQHTSFGCSLPSLLRFTVIVRNNQSGLFHSGPDYPSRVRGRTSTVWLCTEKPP